MMSLARQTLAEILQLRVQMKRKQDTLEQEALLLCCSPPARFGIRLVLCFVWPERTPLHAAKHFVWSNSLVLCIGYIPCAEKKKNMTQNARLTNLGNFLVNLHSGTNVHFELGMLVTLKSAKQAM